MLDEIFVGRTVKRYKLYVITPKVYLISPWIMNAMQIFVLLFKIAPTPYITTINIILIVICNCSILNPGPNINPSSDSCFKLFYQNVHGFITYGSLGNKYPVLNITKLLEFQAYVANNYLVISNIIHYWILHMLSSIFNSNILLFTRYNFFFICFQKPRKANSDRLKRTLTYEKILTLFSRKNIARTNYELDYPKNLDHVY